MSKFDAGTAVEALEYDFTAYGGSSGTIPEPTEEALDAFMRTVREVALTVRFSSTQKTDPNEMGPDEMLDALSEMDEDVMKGSLSRIATSLAALCSNTPSEEDIARLPFRVRQAFMGWLVGQFRPELQTAGTKP